MKHYRIRYKLTGFEFLVLIGVIAVFSRVLATYGVVNGANILLVNRLRETDFSIESPRCGSDKLNLIDEVFVAQLRKLPLEEATVLRNIARIHWFTGACEEARDLWLQVIVIDPDDAVTNFAITNALYWTGDKQGALDIDKTADIYEYFYARALLSYNYRAFATATDWYQIATDINPTVQGLQGLGKSLEQIGEYDKAFDTWMQLANFSTDTDPLHWEALARMSIIQKDWFSAAEFWGMAASFSPEPYDYRIRQGDAAVQGADWETASDAYQIARQLVPCAESAYLKLGNLARIQGDYSAALLWYAEADRLAPGDPLIIYRRGQIHWLQKDYDTANLLFREAVLLSPNWDIGLFYLALSEYELGYLSQASEHLEAAIESTSSFEQRQEWQQILGTWASLHQQ